MIVYPEELMAQRIKELEVENARLRGEALGRSLKDTCFAFVSAGNQVILPSTRRQDQ